MEEWRIVPGYETYEVSSHGQVRGRRGILKPRVRPSKRPPVKGGYLSVALYSPSGRAERAIHHLVLEAFVGPRPEGCHACHNNDNPNNNRLDNLRWDTPSGNRRDRVDAGAPCKRGHALERGAEGHCNACRREAYHNGK